MKNSIGEMIDVRKRRKVCGVDPGEPTPLLPHITHDALLDCCRSIYDVTLEIEEALRSDNWEALIAKLQARENLIKEVVSPQTGQDFVPQEKRIGTTKEEGDANSVMGEIKTLLQATLSLDDVNKEKIVRKRKEITRDLKKLLAGRQLLRSSYMASPMSGANFIDVV